jgi:hypothetical protein
MNYQKIDACEDKCMLFWKEHEKTTHYIQCGKSRYAVVLDEDGNEVTTNVSIKQLWYIPITPRLKRLFLNQETAKQMRWHKEVAQDGVEPSMIQVYVEGHKGPDPNHSEMLCDSGATEKLVSMKIDPISNFNVFFSLY